jgi:hypothetical protein
MKLWKIFTSTLVYAKQSIHLAAIMEISLPFNIIGIKRWNLPIVSFNCMNGKGHLEMLFSQIY